MHGFCLALTILLVASCHNIDVLRRATVARDHAAKVIKVSRVDARTISSKQLLGEYVLRDEPVILTNTMSNSDLQALIEIRWWEPGMVNAPEVFARAAAKWPGMSDATITWTHDFTTTGSALWGCSRMKQCLISWWQAGLTEVGRKPNISKGLFGTGAVMHTDAICLPAWSLQVVGTKRWAFSVRTEAETGVPIGDDYQSDTVWAADVAPGELMVFYNGWQPHATEPLNGVGADLGVAAIHGVLDFDRLPQRLWSPEVMAMRARASGVLATLSSRLLDRCPNVRDYATEGIAAGLDVPVLTDSIHDVSTCERASRTNLPNGASDAAWRTQLPATMSLLGGVDVGYMSSPALGDVDGDNDVDVVVGDAMGGVWCVVNVGASPRAPAFGAAVLATTVADGKAYDARAIGRRLASPALGDLEGDGRLDLVVGYYNGTLEFFASTVSHGAAPQGTGGACVFEQTLAAIELGPHFRRAAPVLADTDGDGDLDLVFGTERGSLHLLRNVGTPEMPIFGGIGDVIDYEVRGAAATRSSSPAFTTLGGNASIVIGDGGTTRLRYYMRESGKLAWSSAQLMPFTKLDLDVVGDSFPLEIGLYPAPALGDINNDGIADIVLGELYGHLFFIDGSEEVPSEYTELGTD